MDESEDTLPRHAKVKTTEDSAIRTVIVTPSHARDYSRCSLLCDSVARFVSGHTRHVLVVVRSDRSLFASLAKNGTEILVTEDLLPFPIYRLPFNPRWWLSFSTFPIRGWILQQLVKLSMAEAVDADLYLFVDSDVLFVRPFEVHSIIRDGRVRLYRGLRKPRDFTERRHRNWYRCAGRLFGLCGDAYLQRDYISTLVSWRRDTLRALTQYIATCSGSRWQVALANTLDFSEYTLYGLFAEYLLGEEQSGHYWDEEEICYCSWHHEIRGEQGLLDFLHGMPERYCAVLIQSNLGFEPSLYTQALAHLHGDR